jgi:hypothetical protein
MRVFAMATGGCHLSDRPLATLTQWVAVYSQVTKIKLDSVRNLRLPSRNFYETFTYADTIK